MAYTLTIPILLDPADTGLSLGAQLVNTTGANVGSEVTTGFVEIGSGVYSWTYASFPDGHRGGVKFQLSGGGALQAFTAINPEEAENTDAKTSTRLAPTTAGRTLDVSAGGEAGVDWANVGSPTTVVGLSGTTVKNATDVQTTLGAPSGASIAADIATRLATAGYTAPDNATIAAIAAFVDTEIAAIKAKTDSLTFTSAGKVDAKLTSDGLDLVLVESGITAGAGLTNDMGTQLTSLNARQALALFAAALEGVLAGAATTTITIKPAAKPAGNTRVTATVDSAGNRTALTLKVPD